MNEPRAARQRRRGVILLTVIVALVGMLVVATVTAPPKVVSVVQLRLSAPGADVFFGDQNVGRGDVEISLEGGETFLLPVADLQPASARTALQLLGEVVAFESISSFSHNAQPFPLSGQTHSVLVKRGDGTLDSILLVVLDIPAAWTGAIPIRARQGGNSALAVGATGVSGSSSVGDLFRRVVLRRQDSQITVMAELSVSAAPELLEEHSATGWWLAEQPR